MKIKLTEKDLEKSLEVKSEEKTEEKIEEKTEEKTALVPSKTEESLQTFVLVKENTTRNFCLFLIWRHGLLFALLGIFNFIILGAIHIHVVHQNRALKTEINNLKQLYSTEDFDFIKRMTRIKNELPEYTSVVLETKRMVPNGMYSIDRIVFKAEEYSPENNKAVLGTVAVVYDNDPKDVKLDPSSVIQCSMNSANNVTFAFNAADAIKGAFVVQGQSSKTVSVGDDFEDQVSNFFGDVDNGFVVLDRKEIPSDKAWCSNEKNPVLTIRLSEYIKPTAVSYQHAHWSNVVPNGAPKLYDVVACLNAACNKTVPLVTDCEYKSGPGPCFQQQFCKVPSNKDLPLTNKVQILFRENHGNATKTCAYRIRVHGKPVIYIPEKSEVDQDEEVLAEFHKRKQIPRNSRFTNCSDLAWYHNNLPILYNARRHTCPRLYSEECCDECPRCCKDCRMEPGIASYIQLAVVVLVVLSIPIFIMFVLYQIYSILDKCYMKNNHYN
ncbi:unnamed protein product [Caenorhabditis brenneri]